MDMDFDYLMYKFNRGDIELTPRNRAIFEWELMKSIDIFMDDWGSIVFWLTHERRKSLSVKILELQKANQEVEK